MEPEVASDGQAAGPHPGRGVARVLPAAGAAPLEIRPLTVADLSSATRLDRLCFARGSAFSRSTFARFMRHPGYLGWAAHCGPHRGSQLVALVIALVHRPAAGCDPAAEIVTLDVHPRWRRRGLGRELLRRAAAGATARGVRRVGLHVATDNAAALALYRGEGYRVTGRAPNYYGPGRDAFAMLRQPELPAAPP